MLTTKDLKKSFGGVRAIDGLDFEIKDQEILGLIGPNGAGKTTFFNLVSGLLKPDYGTIMFKGEDITGAPAREISKKGISRTYQNIKLFENLTVIENILIPAKYSLGVKGDMSEIIDLSLSPLGLIDKKDSSINKLSFKEKKCVEIARALASSPDLIMLDEPTSGLDHIESQELVDILKELNNDRKITILIIEHDMKVAMGISERIVVLDSGKKLAEGVPNDIKKNPEVIKSYLGEKYAAA